MSPTRHRPVSPGPRHRSPGPTRSLIALGAVTAIAATALSSIGPGVGPAAAAEAPSARTVRLDPSYQHPSFEGWGTALAWFANVTGGWPDARRKALADALYGADGLGFTIARYNIGGGDSPGTTPYMRAGAAVPGWWNRPGPESPDWWDPDRADHWKPDADANQRWWLTAAKDRGATTFEAFSNSAPYFMTNSGRVSGNDDAGQDNLRSDQYERFAAYLTGALQRAESASGVTFDSLSPVNEPDTDYWRAGGRQEGSHWDRASQARIITAVRAKLVAEGLATPIAAMDETNPDKFRGNWESYAPDVRDAVGRLNTHTYGTNGRTGVRDTAKGAGTPLWMSEVDVGGTVGQSFTDMSPALDLADRINDDLRELEPRAWVLWQAVEDYENMTPAHENSNWGLIQTDFTPEDAATEPLRKNKKYWAMGNYSRFVRPGARVMNTDDPQTLAAVRPGGDGVVVVHTNSSGEERDLTLNLDGFRTAADGPVERWTTDATKNLQRDGDVAVAGRTLKATVGPGSVTTFVLPTVKEVEPAAATAPTGAPRRLLGDHSGKALAVATADGDSTPVQRTVDPADATQHWIFTKLSSTDWGNTAAYRITNAAQDRALTVSDDTLTLAPPGSSAAQEWVRSTTGDGRHTLINRASGLLLDVTDASTGEGARVGVHPPTTGGNQSWTFQDTAPDTWKPLAFRHSSRCLDVGGAASGDGAAVVQYGCGSGRNQQWSLRATGGGYVNAVARHSGKCLDVGGLSTADGADVSQYTCNGGRNQEWAVRSTGDGYLTLTARHSGKCLDVRDAATDDGAAVVQRTCDGAESQRIRRD